MEHTEIEKSKPFFANDLMDRNAQGILSTTVLRKLTGQIVIFSFEKGQSMAQKTSPFDIFIQIINGKSEIIIDHASRMLEAGESIVIPAHCHAVIKASTQFIMIQTIIKSGYEDVL